VARFVTAVIEVDPTDPKDHLILYNVEVNRPFLMAGERWEATSVRTVKGGVRLTIKVVR